jgi:hypothetical protein
MSQTRGAITASASSWQQCCPPILGSYKLIFVDGKMHRSISSKHKRGACQEVRSQFAVFYRSISVVSNCAYVKFFDLIQFIPIGFYSFPLVDNVQGITAIKAGTNLFVLIRSYGDKLSLGKHKSLESAVRQSDEIVCLYDVQTRLIFVHRVENRLQNAADSRQIQHACRSRSPRH